MATVLTRYLARYAEAEARLRLDDVPVYESVLVVPCFDEGNAIQPLVDSLKRNDVLAIFVVNETPETSASQHQNNLRTIELLAAHGSAARIDVGIHVRRAAGADVLIVERTRRTKPLRKGSGVGTARKIGADIAAALHASGHLRDPWIHTTDADAILPDAYFEAIPHELAVGYIRDFQHQPPTPDAAAYECHLRLYACGLHFAGSPYAFHAVGSTISVHVDAYAKVRGVPKRAAGEDFYLLNKLAKIGAIEQTDVHPLTLSSRPSHRTPFGTGAALSAGTKRTYAPRIYQLLRCWLDAIELGPTQARGYVEKQLGPEASAVVTHLETLGAWRALERAQQETRSRSAYLRHAHTYFDAFRTMKFVRALSPHYGEVAVEEAFQDWPAPPASSIWRMDQLRRSAAPLVGLSRSNATQPRH